MNGVVLAIAAILYVGILTIPARAAPLHYQESVSGDLPADPAATILPLDVGTNTLQGSSFMSVNLGPPLDFEFDPDSFTIVIPANDALTVASYTYSITNNTNVTDATMTFGLGSPFAPSVVDLFGPSTVNFTFLGFNGPEPVPFFNNGTQTITILSGANEGSIQWDYTWTFTVISTNATVPEPSSALVLLSALGGLLGFRGLRQRAS